jgi:gas vesicle protein
MNPYQPQQQQQQQQQSQQKHAQTSGRARPSRGVDEGEWNESQEDQRRGEGEPLRQVAEVALRGSALIFDMQMDVMRSLWQAQARSAAMLGAPDFADLFRADDQRARRMFSSSAEQVAQTLRQTTQAVLAVHREISRAAERQAIGIGEQMRQQFAEFGQETQRSLEELQQSAMRHTGELDADADRSRPRQSKAGEAGRRGEQDGERTPAGAHAASNGSGEREHAANAAEVEAGGDGGRAGGEGERREKAGPPRRSS